MMRCFRDLDVALLSFSMAFMVGIAGNAGAKPPGIEKGSELRLTVRDSETPVRGSFLGMERDEGTDILRVEIDGDSLAIATSNIQKLEVKTGKYSGQEVKNPVAFGILLGGVVLGCAYWAGSSVDGSTGLKILAGLGGAYGGMFVFGKIAHETWPVHNAGEPRWKTVPPPVSTAGHFVPDPCFRAGLQVRF